MTSKGRIGEIIEVRRSAQELSLEWPIPNFLSLRCGPGDWYKSPRFSFWDGCWNLRVWPDWYSKWVHIGLSREDSGTSVKTVNVAFGVKLSNGVEKRAENEWEVSNNGIQCLGYYFTISELTEQKHRLMPNDVLTITCEMKTHGTVRDANRETDDSLKEPNTNGKQAPGKKDDPIHEEEVKVLTEESQASEKQDATIETGDDLKEPLANGKQAPGRIGVEELLKSLHGLLAGGEDSDVRISVGGKEFPAHRAILRARSPVFKAMFAHDMVEKQSGVVTMEDCNPEMFTDFLEHVYTGSVEMISDSNVFDLYRTSDKYDLSTLKMQCTEFLKQYLSVASFCNTITLAIRHGDKDLTARATTFFCENSIEISESVEWQTFIQKNPTVGNELFIKALKYNQNK